MTQWPLCPCADGQLGQQLAPFAFGVQHAAPTTTLQEALAQKRPPSGPAGGRPFGNNAAASGFHPFGAAAAAASAAAASGLLLKRCRMCLMERNLAADFDADAAQPDGMAAECRTCAAATQLLAWVQREAELANLTWQAIRAQHGDAAPATAAAKATADSAADKYFSALAAMQPPGQDGSGGAAGGHQQGHQQHHQQHHHQQQQQQQQQLAAQHSAALAALPRPAAQHSGCSTALAAVLTELVASPAAPRPAAELHAIARGLSLSPPSQAAASASPGGSQTGQPAALRACFRCGGPAAGPPAAAGGAALPTCERCAACGGDVGAGGSSDRSASASVRLDSFGSRKETSLRELAARSVSSTSTNTQQLLALAGWYGEGGNQDQLGARLGSALSLGTASVAAPEAAPAQQKRCCLSNEKRAACELTHAS